MVLTHCLGHVSLSLITIVNASFEAVLFLILAVEVIADGNFRGPHKEQLCLVEISREPTGFTSIERLSLWDA